MALGTAIRHLRKGDWTKAHALVQNDESALGCWAHGIAHMMEGDIGNARYWYRRAHRLFPRDADPASEIAALTAAIKETHT
jgi:Flp pilus assembly protein TadD